MKRAVAFLRDIKSSKRLAGAFEQVIDAYDGTDEDVLACSVRHVDGTFNALQRNRELSWLKAPVPHRECRILSNARCLSEGVDVPALDAVMFLNPRNSVVDVAATDHQPGLVLETAGVIRITGTARRAKWCMSSLVAVRGQAWLRRRRVFLMESFLEYSMDP